MCPVMWAFTPTGVLKQKKKNATLYPIPDFEIGKKYVFPDIYPKVSHI